MFSAGLKCLKFSAMSTVFANILSSIRGGVKIEVEGHFYRKYFELKNGNCAFNCVNYPKCSAVVYTLPLPNEGYKASVYQKKEEHNHAPGKDTKKKAAKVLKRLKAVKKEVKKELKPSSSKKAVNELVELFGKVELKEPVEAMEVV